MPVVENSTPNRGYPLPHASNDLNDDVARLIVAMTGIDLDMANLIAAVATKAAAVHEHVITDTTGLSAALTGKQDLDEKGQANGYAALDATGKVPTGQLPSAVLGAMSYQGTWNASTNTPTIPAASAGNKGHFYKVATAGSTNVSGVTDWQIGDWIVSNGASWDKIDNTDQVTRVAGKQGDVTLVKGDVGLGNIDNTSDANKPVSTAQQTALDGKAASAHTHTFASLTSKPTTLAGYGITDAPVPDYAAGNAALAFGGVGTYVWGGRNNLAVTHGATYAGSSIVAQGIRDDPTNTKGMLQGGVSTPTLAGTWRAMGWAAASGNSNYYNQTLFLRIS